MKKYQSSVFQEHHTMVFEEVNPGITRQVLGYDSNIMTVKVLFKKNAVGLIHEHYHAQTTYIASGRFEVTIGKERKVLSVGDGFYVPPHVSHGVVCLEEGMLIDNFSPYREDFLEAKK